MSVGAVTSSTTTSTTDGSARLPQKTLGQDDFLKLLVTQMSNQDPMNPQSDTNFIAQMAQFSSLEQAKSTTTQLSNLSSQQEFTQAAALLDRTVQVQSGTDSSTTSGVVSAIQFQDGSPKLLINGSLFSLSQVISVTPTVVSQ